MHEQILGQLLEPAAAVRVHRRDIVGDLGQYAVVTIGRWLVV